MVFDENWRKSLLKVHHFNELIEFVDIIEFMIKASEVFYQNCFDRINTNVDRICRYQPPFSTRIFIKLKKVWIKDS